MTAAACGSLCQPQPTCCARACPWLGHALVHDCILLPSHAKLQLAAVQHHKSDSIDMLQSLMANCRTSIQAALPSTPADKKSKRDNGRNKEEFDFFGHSSKLQDGDIKQLLKQVGHWSACLAQACQECTADQLVLAMSACWQDAMHSGLLYLRAFFLNHIYASRTVVHECQQSAARKGEC